MKKKTVEDLTTFKSKLDYNEAGEVLPTQNNMTLVVDALQQLILHHNTDLNAPHIESLKDIK